jgi:hypothetical protein
VIYFQDYLNREEIKNMNIDSDQSSLNSCNDSDVISFPTDTVDEVSKEEIGKWVDQLMDMPEPDSSFSNRFENLSEDPLTQVAERILSEESF